MTTLSVSAQACKPAASTTSRPKPKPNPRRKLIDPSEGTAVDRIAVRSIIVNSVLNVHSMEIVKTAHKLLALMDRVRERDEGTLYGELVAAGYDPVACDIGTLRQVDEDCAGFRWCLERFVQAMAENCIPRSQEETDLLYDGEPEGSEPVHDRPAAPVGKRVPR